MFALALTGCGDSNTYVEPPPPQVSVAVPLIQDVTAYLEFTGNTAASGKAEVRARVAGVLTEMLFEPGTQVEQGAVLFQIDPREFEANLQSAQADLASARAEKRLADTELARARKLFKNAAGSESDVDKWRGELGRADAAMLSAEARIMRARLDLDFARVEAPISGRVGREQVDIGNLVGEGEATLLTEVTRYSPMYVYFNLNERDLLRVREQAEADDVDRAPDRGDRPRLPVYLGLANETGYPHEGWYEFGESGVDPDTGTLELRAIFENRARPPVLLPGLFARIRLPIETLEDMPLVSERAIGQDQGGQYLLVVNDENIVERRSIQTGERVDGLIAITEGLRPGERVVVQGVQRARPGRKVDPETIDMASLTTSASQQAAAAAEQEARTQRDPRVAGSQTGQ